MSILFTLQSSIMFLFCLLFCLVYGFFILFAITTWMSLQNIGPVMRQQAHSNPMSSFFRVTLKSQSGCGKRQTLTRAGNNARSVAARLPTRLPALLSILSKHLAASYTEHYTEYANTTAELPRTLPIQLLIETLNVNMYINGHILQKP